MFVGVYILVGVSFIIATDVFLYLYTCVYHVRERESVCVCAGEGGEGCRVCVVYIFVHVSRCVYLCTYWMVVS